MKKTALGLLAWMILASSNLHAGSYWTTRIGNQTWTTGPDGYSACGQQIGDQYFFSDNYGTGWGIDFGPDYSSFSYTPLED
jgi:hypothetical protein